MRYLQRHFSSSCVLAVALAMLGITGLTRAADPAAPAGSLKLVPSDAAFYNAMLRGGEQIEAIAKSKAWAKVKTMPSVKMILQMAEAQLKNPKDPNFAQIVKFYQQPENQELIALLKDMISHEVFCYGGEGSGTFLELMAVINNAQQLGNLMALIQQARDADRNKIQVQTMLRPLVENLDLIRIPDVVIGFKVRKPDVAEAQVTRLAAFVIKALEQAPPPIQERFKKGKGMTMLTLTLHGALLPWDKISLKDFEDKEGQFDELVEKLKKLKLTISLGLHGDYVILALGESSAFLSKLGRDTPLADRPELRPLQKYAGRRLTSIGYVSKQLHSRTGVNKKELDGMALEAKKYLEKSAIPPELKEKLIKDLGDLSRDIKSFVHEQGATLSFAFLDGHGQESFTYDWSAYPGLDGSKPLTLLNHVGGTPLVAIVGRSKYQPENYQKLVKWVKRAHGYFEDFVLPRLDDTQKGQVEQLTTIFKPLVERLDTATGTMLLPSLKEGQSAFVLDAKLQSKHWHKDLPTTDKAMAMLEPALVFGVSDADLLKKAVSEYRDIINELISKIHNLSPLIPDYQIPEPETLKLTDGTIYYYPLQDELGLDKQLAPNAGLSRHVAVLSLSQSHSERLLTRTALKLTGPLADLSKPLAGAVYLDWAATVTALGPWLELGIEEGMRRQLSAPPAEEEKPGAAKKDAPPKPPSLEEILQQVRTGLEVLKCFRGYSSASYFEGKALVTHGQAVFEDLP